MSISTSRTTSRHLSLDSALEVSMLALYGAVLPMALLASWYFRDQVSALAAIPLFIYFAILLIVLPCTMQRDKLNKERKRNQRSWRRSLLKESPWIGRYDTFCIILDNAFLSFAIACFVAIGIYISAVTLALAADAVQAYELAERIFVVVPFPHKGDNSLVAFGAHYLNNTEDNHDERLKKAIANVYGSESQQMAHLLFMEGENCRAEGSGRGCGRSYMSGNKQLAGAQLTNQLMNQILEAEQWYRKSILLNERLGSYGGCVDALGGIAICQHREGAPAGEIEESRRSFNRALDLIKNHSEIKPTADTFETLAWAARYNGNNELEESLFHSSRVARIELDHEAGAWLLCAFKCIAVGVLIKLTANAFALSFRVVELRRLSNKWLCQVGGCSDLQTKVDALNSLTTLALYRRKYQKADAYSLQLLKLCENHSF